MKTKQFILVVVAVIGLAGSVYADPENGKSIFISRCAGCHNVNKALTGPALAGVEQRHDMEWIIRFVNSSQTVVKSGDKQAVALFEKFNKVTMPDHADLTSDNIKSILDYIKSAAVVTDAKAPFARPGQLMTLYQPLSLSKDYVVFVIYLAAVALLIMVLLFAVHLKDFRSRSEDNASA